MALTREFPYGATVRVRGTFTNPTTGAVLDPTVVKVSYRLGRAGTVTTKIYGTDPEVVKEGTGIYYLDLNLSTVGDWHWRIWSTGTGQTADEGTIRVPASNFD